MSETEAFKQEGFEVERRIQALRLAHGMQSWMVLAKGQSAPRAREAFDAFWSMAETPAHLEILKVVLEVIPAHKRSLEWIKVIFDELCVIFEDSFKPATKGRGR